MSDDIEISPAVSARQWEEFKTGGGRVIALSGGVDVGSLSIGLGVFTEHEGGVQPPEHRHALAALALHGQPFGFTWDDVELLEGCAELLPSPARISLRSIADRLASLLPPRKEGMG